MEKPHIKDMRRVLIASANPLYGKGLEKLLTQKAGGILPDIRIASTMAETLAMLEEWKPDLVIVDYDDQTIDRGQFLNQFIAGDRAMQVMLVSLKASGTAVVYDRRTLSPDQTQDWLQLPIESQPSQGSVHPRRSEGMKHFIIVAVLVAVSTVLVNLLLQNIGLLPVEASTQATIIDRLFNTHFLVISFLFSLIVVFLVYSLVVFRRRKEDAQQEGKFFKGSTRLEVLWTILPLGTVIYFSYLGSLSLAETRRVDPQALEVKVIGRQWSWTFEYPEFGIVSDTLQLPVNRQVLLKMTSEDVIHSFWVPEFRVKQDLLPGENLVKELRITPTIIGSYKVRCAELCGTLHAYMESPVVVVSDADFQAWVDEEVKLLNADPATRGERVSKQNGCLACHSVDGTRLVGPSWLGLYESQRELADGTTVVADDAYLLNSIIKPNAHVVAGYPPGVMPQSYVDSLSDTQLSDIIAFIKTLK